MAGMSWASGAVPVAIDAAHTGVTDGNAATQSSTCWPRSMSVLSTGACPDATARSSMAGFIASMTVRTSLRATWLPEDPQSGVLLALASATADQQPRQAPEQDQRKRRKEHRRAGAHSRHALAVERQRKGGVGIQPAADPHEQRARGRPPERGRGSAADQSDDRGIPVVLE